MISPLSWKCSTISTNLSYTCSEKTFCICLISEWNANSCIKIFIIGRCFLQIQIGLVLAYEEILHSFEIYYQKRP